MLILTFGKYYYYYYFFLYCQVICIIFIECIFKLGRPDSVLHCKNCFAQRELQICKYQGSSHQSLHILFSRMQQRLMPMSLTVSTGPGKVPSMYCSAGRVASDSPPVLLGADVDLLLRTKLEGGLQIC